jgi:Rod binding domain-containing protein
MSAVNPTSSLGSEPITPPPGVKFENADQENLYRAALEFERFFVQNMLKDVQSTAALGGGEDGAAGSAGLDGYRDMAKDQMTQAVLDGGGLGLASTLYGQMADQFGIATDASKDAAGDDAAAATGDDASASTAAPARTGEGNTAGGAA